MNKSSINGPPAATPHVGLFWPPYGALERPAIGISQLKAGARELGLNVKCFYPTFWFANRIGLRPYYTLTECIDPSHMLGEWTFSSALREPCEEFDVDSGTYLEKVFSDPSAFRALSLAFNSVDSKLIRSRLYTIRSEAEDFTKAAAKTLLESGAPVFGCSSTFEQNCAGLAILKEIRRRRPDSILLMGGANCDGDMGAALHKSFPWVDHVFSGEANESFLSFARSYLDQTLAGERRKAGREGRSFIKSLPVQDIDQVPLPDYQDYFSELTTFNYKDRVTAALPAELSRGCWFGAKSHCVFCGLNGDTMSFRSRTPESAYEHLRTLSSRYGSKNISLIDNILDTRYFKSLLPSVRDLGLNVFAEVKANLTEEQVSALSESGFRWIQPGIESLSTDICRKLKKGTNKLINLSLLKYCIERGVHVSWNMLYGLPDEDDSCYAEVVSLIPWVIHLQPPTGATKIRIDRFSPYFQKPDDHGMHLTPSWAYRHVYPQVPSDKIAEIAYFFQSAPSADETTHPSYVFRLRKAISAWQERFYTGAPETRPLLVLFRLHGRRVVLDTRRGNGSEYISLSQSDASVLEGARCPSGVSNLFKIVSQSNGRISASEIEASYEKMVELKFIVEDDGACLSIVTHPPTRGLPAQHQFAGGDLSVSPLAGG